MTVQLDLGGEGERSGAKGQRCGRDGSERGAHGSGAQTEEGMSRLIGISTTALLFALGILHVYWAAGGKWGTDVTIPKQDGTPLFQPPPAGTLLVAIPLFSAGLVVLGRLGLWGAALPR